MNFLRLRTRCLHIGSIGVFSLVATFSTALAQPGIKELPVVARPKQRSNTESIVIRSAPQQPTKGTLAVVLNYKVGARVVVKDLRGRQIARTETDAEGQVEFQLLRGKIYQVEVDHPSYLGSSGKTKVLGATEILRLDLTPQFAILRFRNLPQNAQVFIDNELRATADKTGGIAIDDLKPGKRDLLIRHPEYNDYIDELTNLEAGNDYTYPRIKFARVSRIAIQGPPSAIVLIDGEMHGRIKSDGTVKIDYELETLGEHVISVEQTGYQTWSKREVLTPGVRTITAKLDPILTSAGVSDLFENLSLWSAPPTWKIVSDGRNKRLQVQGEQLGLLKGNIYRDFVVNFTVWLDDSKGASWVVRADKEGRNYYLFHLSGLNESSDRTPRRLYIYRVADGGKPVEVSTPVPIISSDLNNKTSYTVEIVVEGNKIRQTITSNGNGIRDDLGTFTDTSIDKDKFLYGTFGFRSLAGETFTVDDLTISLELPKDQ